MKRYAIVALAIGMLMGLPAWAQDAAATAKAQEAAEQWLALTDKSAYAASWDQAAGMFKGAITQANWENAVRAARSPLGAVKSRHMKSARYATTLPGAPDGEYVVLQFDTEFENKANGIETVTPLKDKDGAWRVGGYYIK